jgi:polyphosphate glucokinase
MDILAIDIGGSHVKLAATGQAEHRQFDSGKHLTSDMLVRRVVGLTRDWHHDVITLGFPGHVGPDGPREEPGNLGCGWVEFDFEKAFGVPVRVVNDAAMQALGGYDGGRMLFLGLGTGLGSALVIDRVVVHLELGSLPDGDSTLGDRLGKKGLEREGKAAWQKTVAEATKFLRDAFAVDYLVLGGGNAAVVDPLPPHVRRGGNEDAFTGGFRIWDEEVEVHQPNPWRAWRVV